MPPKQDFIVRQEANAEIDWEALRSQAPTYGAIQCTGQHPASTAVFTVCQGVTPS